jgi:YHS domain-containing protein
VVGREAAAMVKTHGEGQFDPICGRKLAGERELSPFSSEYKKRTYYFCSERCRTAFERHAEKLRMSEMAKVGSLLSPGRVSWGLA